MKYHPTYYIIDIQGLINPVNMPLRAGTGPVLVRCCQHWPSTGPVLVHNGMFMGVPWVSTTVCTAKRLDCHNQKIIYKL